MKHLSPILVLSLSLSAVAALTGCAGTSTPDAAAPAVARDMNRADAIASARADAHRSYGADWGSRVNASYEGGFWVVDLYAPSGYRLRYAISARDGSIRERNMMQ